MSSLLLSLKTSNLKMAKTIHLTYRCGVLISFFFLLLSFQPYLVSTSNNLPLLVGTLRTYQVSACDNEDIKLECDSRTVVSIVVAHYGQPVPQKFMCRSFFQTQVSSMKPQSALLLPDINVSNQYYVPIISDDDHRSIIVRNQKSLSNYINRLSPTNRSRNQSSLQCPEYKHLRYKFLLKIEETCREKHRCGLKVNATNIGFKQDPCGHVVKFGEIAYKCRPNRFVNKIICEGNSIMLQCNNEDRIAIFSAEFGASWFGVPECPGSSISQNEQILRNNKTFNCQDSYATETVMRMCHAKSNCTIEANYDMFSPPKCPIGLKYYLKLVYTCISKKMFQNSVLNAQRSTSTTTTTTASTSMTTVNSISSNEDNLILVMVDNDSKNGTLKSNTDLMMDSSNDGNNNPLKHEQSWRTKLSLRKTILLANGEHINCTELSTQMQVIGFMSDWISAIGFVKKNQERFILYLLVSLFGALVCFLTVLSARLYYQKGVAVKKMQQEQTLVPHFNFEDIDENLDDIEVDEGNIEDEDNATVCKQLMMVPSTSSNIVGLRDYTVQRPSTGYSNIRRPHSGTILPSEQQPPTKPAFSTIGRVHYHHHHHSQQRHSQPRKTRYSTMAPTNARIIGFRSSSSVSPTTLTTLPKSILRDSRVQTPANVNVDVEGQQKPTVATSSSMPTTISTGVDNVNNPDDNHGSTVLFRSNQKISSHDLIPPPTIISSSSSNIPSTLTEVTFQPLMGSTGSSIYQMIRCPKFPVNEHYGTSMQQLEAPQIETVQEQSILPRSTTVVIESHSNVEANQETMIENDCQTEPKMLSSSLRNFLV